MQRALESIVKAVNIAKKSEWLVSKPEHADLYKIHSLKNTNSTVHV